MSHLLYQTFTTPKNFNKFYFEKDAELVNILSVIQYFISRKKGEYNHDAKNIIICRKILDGDFDWNKCESKLGNIDFSDKSILDINKSCHVKLF